MTKRIKMIRLMMSIAITVLIIVGIVEINPHNVYADNMSYKINVNIGAGCVTVYRQGTNGEFTVAVKAMSCSVGIEDGSTPIGNYSIGGKEEWTKMSDGSYARYTVQIGYNIMFRSASYSSRKNDSLNTEEYNKIGEPASDGSIVLSAADAKWIYDNCMGGTIVEVYELSADPGPLGKPDTIKIPSNSADSGWDPTDDDSLNPWKNHTAVITGTKNLVTDCGKDIDLFEGIKAEDTCGNDITDSLMVVGEYDFMDPGEYSITYTVEDAIGSIASKEITLIVRETGEEKTDTTVSFESNSGQESDTVPIITQPGSEEVESNNDKMVTIISLAGLTLFISILVLRYVKKD